VTAEMAISEPQSSYSKVWLVFISGQDRELTKLGRSWSLQLSLNTN